MVLSGLFKVWSSLVLDCVDEAGVYKEPTGHRVVSCCSFSVSPLISLLYLSKISSRYSPAICPPIHHILGSLAHLLQSSSQSLVLVHISTFNDIRSRFVSCSRSSPILSDPLVAARRSSRRCSPPAVPLLCSPASPPKSRSPPRLFSSSELSASSRPSPPQFRSACSFARPPRLRRPQCRSPSSCHPSSQIHPAVTAPFLDSQPAGCCKSRRMRIRSCLEVWKMGTVNYANALKLQERLVSDRKAQKISDTLLSLQHPPTYTLGKRKTEHNLLLPKSELKNIGVELHYTERGGDVTFHGPRQAILYPIISLRDVGVGARSYVEKLELTMIELASLYGVEASAGRKCETGVWVGERKIGAIGVRIQSGITSHGLAFNIDPDLGYFKNIVPCGIKDKDVTSLSRETKLELPSDEVIHQQLISCFAKQFGYTTNLFDKTNIQLNT